MKRLALSLILFLIFPTSAWSTSCITTFDHQRTSLPIERFVFRPVELQDINEQMLTVAQDHPDSNVNIEYTSSDGSYLEAQVSYKRQSQLSRRRRNFLETLRQLSNLEEAFDVEYGGLIVEFEDGSSKAIRLTSSLPTLIRGEDWSSAIRFSGVEFNGALRMTKVIHIHTHPWSSSHVSMLPSPQDVISYQARILANDAYDFDMSIGRNQVGGKVDFEAYILPLCRRCDDIYIHMTAEQILNARPSLQMPSN